MTDKTKSTFARRIRAAKPRANNYDLWDDVISGLGVRVRPSGTRTFFLRRTVRGRVRFATLGNADALTLPEARREARRLIVTFIDTIKKNDGPRTPGHPMDAFAAEFLERQARHWKPRTLETNQWMVRKYILPAFGHLSVDALTPEQVQDWFASMSERPGAANRSMPVLSMMMKMAELWGYRLHNTNPCKKTKRYRMPPRERFLSAQEMARLNAVLTRDEFYCPQSVAIIRLLLLTGCRVGEVVSLEWNWIKGQAHPVARFQVRTAHRLVIQRRPRSHRRHSPIQRGVPVPVSRPSGHAAHRQYLFRLVPYSQRGGVARIAAA